MRRLIILPTMLLTLILSAASCQPRTLDYIDYGPIVPTAPEVTRPRRTIPEPVPTTQPPPSPDGTRPRRTVP